MLIFTQIKLSRKQLSAKGNKDETDNYAIAPSANVKCNSKTSSIYLVYICYLTAH